MIINNIKHMKNHFLLISDSMILFSDTFQVYIKYTLFVELEFGYKNTVFVPLSAI